MVSAVPSASMQMHCQLQSLLTLFQYQRYLSSTVRLVLLIRDSEKLSPLSEPAQGESTHTSGNVSGINSMWYPYDIRGKQKQLDDSHATGEHLALACVHRELISYAISGPTTRNSVDLLRCTTPSFASRCHVGDRCISCPIFWLEDYILTDSRSEISWTLIILYMLYDSNNCMPRKSIFPLWGMSFRNGDRQNLMTVYIWLHLGELS